MDADDVAPSVLVRSLKFIRRINAWLGYTRTTLGYFKRLSQTWGAGETITLLDVATGSADIPIAIARWARGAGFNVSIVGMDRHAHTARCAANAVAREPAIRIARGDALRLPFESQSIDYVLTSMFLHHLDEEEVVAALREMKRVARRGILVADLLRDRRALRWIKLFTAISPPIIRHDARVSVLQAFTAEELLALARRAGVEQPQVRRHFGHRVVLVALK